MAPPASLPQYAVVRYNRGLRNYVLMATGSNSMEATKSLAMRAMERGGEEPDESELTPVFLRADPRASAVTNLYEQGFDKEHAKAILSQIVNRTAMKAAEPQRTGTTFPPLPPRSVGERARYYALIRRQASEAAEREATTRDRTPRPTFDLPPRESTVRADRARRAATEAQGLTCRRLPQEGGPFTYKICTAGSHERPSFFVAAEDANGHIVGNASASWQSHDNTYMMSIKSEKPKYALGKDDPEGLGTRLYERALRAACSVGRARAVTSDGMRSHFSEAYWQKQVRKGRATCVGDGSESYVYRTPLSEAADWFADRRRDNGYNGPGYRAMAARLPQPDNRNKWPCDYYRLSCKGRPDTLDGIRYRIRRVR